MPARANAVRSGCCMCIVFCAFALKWCSPPPPGGSTDVTGPASASPITDCDGTFKTQLSYSTTSTTAIPINGNFFGGQNNIAKITSDLTAKTIDKDSSPLVVKIDGRLTDACQSGSAQYTVKFAANTVVTTINLPAVPFSDVTVPQMVNTSGSPPSFKYDVKLTCCDPAGAGVPAGPFVFDTARVPPGVTVTKITPKDGDCKKKGDSITITVTGTVDPNKYDDTELRLQVTYGNGKHCVLPGTKFGL